MEDTLFVLIDTEKREIRLFGYQNRTIPFKYAFTLPSIISGKQVQYISNVDPANGDDIVDYMATVLDERDQLDEQLFFRCKKEGYTRVAELKLVFSGPKDAKPFSVWGYDIFDRSPTLRKMLDDGSIEILSESEKESLRKSKLDPRAKDKALDQILIQSEKRHFVDDMFENASMFGLDGGDGDIVEGDEDGGPKKEVLTDAEQILREHQWGKDRNA